MTTERSMDGIIHNEVIVIQKCNDCKRFQTVDELQNESTWYEGVVESGLSEEEREEAVDIIETAFPGWHELTIEKDDDFNWDVCYNICPACYEIRNHVCSEKRQNMINDFGKAHKEQNDLNSFSDEKLLSFWMKFGIHAGESPMCKHEVTT